MKRDGYNHIKKWDSWKEHNLNSIPERVRKADYKILLEYLKDMEQGLNCSPIKKDGKQKFEREAGTLLNLASHNLFFLKTFDKPLLKLNKQDIAELQKKIKEGKIKKKDGNNFISFGNYIKDFKAFWNWIIRTDRAKEDILKFASASTDKPSWVYLTESQAKAFFNNLIPYYRTIAWFMYDTGMRATEGNSIQIKHFSKDFKQITISDESAKTFGRTINLKLCSDLIKEYVQANNLKDEDFLFCKNLFSINKYLKENCGKKFGADVVSNPKTKGKYGSFTLYDIRHNAACFWLNRYPTQKDLMYRMGWTNSDMIMYYTGILGQSDKLSDADMIAGEDKPKLYQLERENKENKNLIEALQQQVKSIIENMNSLTLGKKQAVSNEDLNQPCLIEIEGNLYKPKERDDSEE